ncbi:hypothetical protein SRABI106_03970 [Rahnella aquatilis]|nr:hypothetical protein SRABI106_03970 [Rahnella aquatilis]
MRAHHQITAWFEVVGVILHERSAAFQTAGHDFHDAQQGRRFPVTFATKAVAFLHQTLDCQPGQLFHAVQIFKVGRECPEFTLFEETGHTKFNFGSIQQVFTTFAVNFYRIRQAIGGFIFFHQRIDVAFADFVDYADQITNSVGTDAVAELDLSGNFIAFGDSNFTHIIAKTCHFQVLAFVFGGSNAHPLGDTAVRFTVLPVTGYHGVLLTHTGTDEAEFTATVRGLVQVHEVHVHGFPWDFSIELRMELHQRLMQDAQPGNPHFGRREGMQPGDDAHAGVVIVGFTAQCGDFVRRGHQRFEHQFYRQTGFAVQATDHLLGVLFYLT